MLDLTPDPVAFLSSYIPLFWLAILAILAGFGGLIWSADRFVGGSAAIAKNLGLSPMVIGLTIVALGTSAPEIVVSINASIKGLGDLAVGNALGSNLANIGMVLAITALISPLPIQKHLLTQEIPIMLLVTAIAGWFLWDAKLSPTEGIILLALLLPLMAIMIYNQRHHSDVKTNSSNNSNSNNNPDGNLQGASNEIPNMNNLHATFWFILGLTLLIISSKFLVWGAQEVAANFGISPLIVGLTVVAIGTSLPELAASITSALKGHHDMALGNIIGSNIFNILAVMSVPGLFNTPAMDTAVFWRDYTAMAGITLLLVAAIAVDYALRQKAATVDTPANNRGVARLGRRIGSLLLMAYAAYYFLLFSPVTA